MAVYIMRRGGGGSRKVIEGLVAAIGVQYPVGWTCTCTKDSTTLTAKNTAGLVVFSLPAAGTWTVTATTGSGSSAQTKTASVTIAENEVKRINLRSLELLTPANGLNSNYTLGGSASMSSKELHGTGGWYLNQAIDLTSYSKMTVVGKLTSTQAQTIGARIGFASTKTTAFQATSGYVEFPGYITYTDPVTKTSDISGLTGEYYLCREGAACNETITSIILE